MREWNAATYHRISDPLFDLGMIVLGRLELAGDETVLDLGCGTGRLTKEVAARVPRGRVLGLDRSTNMVGTARSYLTEAAGAPVVLLLADALALPLKQSVDAVFSTATLHWVLDHPRAFANIHDALKPGGRFVAQCGGGPNIARVRQRADAILQEPSFASVRGRFQFPWNFADAEMTASRLLDAGFVEVKTFVESAPIIQRDAAAFDEYIRNVICGPYLAAMTDDAQRDLFVERLTKEAADDDPPFELDYWRLNMMARRP
jgi:trans-aconitate 2-methyltransferase